MIRFTDRRRQLNYHRLKAVGCGAAFIARLNEFNRAAAKYGYFNLGPSGLLKSSPKGEGFSPIPQWGH
jgi:hypothetical protein